MLHAFLWTLQLIQFNGKNWAYHRFAAQQDDYGKGE